MSIPLALDQWIDLGQVGCHSITPRAYREPPEDMPLHSAVYDPTRGKIFAVRGGRVFKFNETTLAKENEVQYAGPTLSDSYIAYDSGRDKLWVTYSPSFKERPTDTSPTNDEYIYKLNVDTLAIEQTIGIGANLLSASPFDEQDCNNVIRNLIVNGVQLAFVHHEPNTANGVYSIVFNPDTLPNNLFTRSWGGARWGFIQLFPSSTDYCFASDNNYVEGVQRRTNANVFVSESGGYPVPFSSANTKRIYGFAHGVVNAFFYCANRSNLILKLPDSTTTNGTAIDLGAVVDVWNIRRNPNNGLLYAPDFGGNQVAVINPADDSFVLKSGFDAPWDVVFTSSKAVAIQHSAEGLKEIV